MFYNLLNQSDKINKIWRLISAIETCTFQTIIQVDGVFIQKMFDIISYYFKLAL